jgi:hypothetical protein
MKQATMSSFCVNRVLRTTCPNRFLFFSGQIPPNSYCGHQVLKLVAPETLCEHICGHVRRFNILIRDQVQELSHVIISRINVLAPLMELRVMGIFAGALIVFVNRNR